MTEELEEVVLDLVGLLKTGVIQDFIISSSETILEAPQMDIIKTLEKLVDEGRVVACYNYMEQKMTFKLPEVEDEIER